MPGVGALHEAGFDAVVDAGMRPVALTGDVDKRSGDAGQAVGVHAGVDGLGRLNGRDGRLGGGRRCAGRGERRRSGALILRGGLELLRAGVAVAGIGDDVVLNRGVPGGIVRRIHNHIHAVGQLACDNDIMASLGIARQMDDRRAEGARRIPVGLHGSGEGAGQISRAEVADIPLNRGERLAAGVTLIGPVKTEGGGRGVQTDGGERHGDGRGIALMAGAVHIGIPVAAVEPGRGRQLRDIADGARAHAGGLIVGNIQIGSGIERRRIHCPQRENAEQQEAGKQEADASFFHIAPLGCFCKNEAIITRFLTPRNRIVLFLLLFCNFYKDLRANL